MYKRAPCTWVMTSVFGWIATGFSLTYKLPQIYTLCKHKKHDGLSVVSLLWQMVAYVFYILHGYVIEDLPVLCMGVVAGIQSVIIVVLYYMYKDN